MERLHLAYPAPSLVQMMSEQFQYKRKLTAAAFWQSRGVIIMAEGWLAEKGKEKSDSESYGYIRVPLRGSSFKHVSHGLSVFSVLFSRERAQ